jgi:hypothetical protein
MLSEAVLTAVTAPGVEMVPTGPVQWVAESGLHECEHMPVAIRRR